MIRAALLRPTRIGLLFLLTVTLPAFAGELIVSAASSLSNAFREIAPAFEASHPGTRLLMNFAGSDTLLAQIAKGAPVDVFAAADDQVMDRADGQKLLQPGSRRNFVGNVMVLISPIGSRLQLRNLSDLQSPSVKHIALGRPAGVPAGRYARSALLAAGLWQTIENKAVYTQNVRQALDYVARGEVEAGFVYASDAALLQDKVKIAFVVATTTPVEYPIAIIAGSQQTVQARQFIEHLSTAPAQAVLARHGFMTR